jgi:NAD(P)-dependent dehydrogenase (short-subunit alcohol dehydrogenase family)
MPTPWGLQPYTRRAVDLPSPVLVTGATSGIGAAVAEALVRGGAAVVGIGRSAEKAAAVKARCAGAPGAITMLLGDASLMRDAVRLAAEANAAAGAPFAAVVHCMGTLLVRTATTPEGVDASFTASFLSRFVISEKLALAQGAAIVNVAAAESGKVPSFLRHELAAPGDVGTGMAAHGSAQVANDLFVASLARTAGLRAWGYGPGAVDTDIRREVPRAILCVLSACFAPWTRPPSAAAADIVRLLTDAALPDTGGFASRRGPFTHDPFVLDVQRQDRLVALARSMVAGALGKSAAAGVAAAASGAGKA